MTAVKCKQYIHTLAVSSGIVKSSAVHAAVALAPKDFQTGRGLALESAGGGDILSLSLSPFSLSVSFCIALLPSRDYNLRNMLSRKLLRG